LAPIDCLYLPHRDITAPVWYVTDLESGYCSIVCRAQDAVLSSKDDDWMRNSARESWEYTGLIDWDLWNRQKTTNITYSGLVSASLLREDMDAIDLSKAVSEKVIRRPETTCDAHILRLSDTS
jgi:hypothetical protein